MAALALAGHEAPAAPLPTARPDYSGGGIVNLMSSLLAARGGHSDYAPLDGLPPDLLAARRTLMLVVIDGLGTEWLLRHAPDGLLARHLRRSLTTVFPSTTASAIPCFLTGDAPLQHGLTGWHTWFDELGCVMTVLPGTPRYGGVSYRRAGIDPARLLGLRSLFARLRTDGVMIAPRWIADSDFNRLLRGPATLRVFETLEQWTHQCVRAARAARRPCFIYAYWPGLDSVGHEKGMHSAAAADHFNRLERALERLLDRLAGTDTLLLVSADHGQIDSDWEARIDLADHPDLAECLALPLCGEPRAAFCYVRAGYTETFAEYCRERLAGLVDCYPSQDLLAGGWFGLGEPHPRIARRIGDFCLLPRDNRVIHQRLPFEEPFQQLGVHGGLSTDELHVPLCLFSV